MRGAAFLVSAAALMAAGAAPLAAKNPTPAERAKAYAKLPYWGGQWLTENNETSIGGLGERSLESRGTGQPAQRANMSLYGFDAPWNAEGQKRNQARLKGEQAGRKADGWGYPQMMNSAAPIQFLITPEEVLIINAYRDVRHIYTDGRKHPDPDDLWPTVWGDSIGHWEGDTLVVDTIEVSNPNEYFHGSAPLSEQAHYVERIRMVAPNRIEDAFTITDPATLSQVWRPTITYQPAEGFDRMVSITYTNDRTGNDAEGNTIEPPKDGK